MENGKWHYLKDEAVGMIATLEKSFAEMTTNDLEIVTARLTDLRIEIGQKRHVDLVSQSDRLESENEAMTGSPKFKKTYCSQCGNGFGPGDHGFSHCSDHRKAAGDGGNGRVYNDLLAAVPEHPEKGEW